MGAELKINCLGDLQIYFGDKRISAFETDKARALLVYLAIESHRELQRSYLAGLLWPDEAEERALHNLRQTLSSLRKTLEKTVQNQEILLANRETIQLNPHAKITVDYLEFKRYFRTALQHYQERSGSGLFHVRLLKKALQFVEGEFLAHFSISKSILFEEWVSLQREEVNLLAVRGFNLLAIYHEKRAETHQAIEYVRRIVELCPWDESAQNRLIQLLGAAQQWTAAKMQFAAMQRYFVNELSASPMQASFQLYDQICLAAEGKATIQPEHKAKPSKIPLGHITFVGREKEQDDIMGLLTNPRIRLVTLTGLGGIGKTRLALEITNQFAGVFQDGVFFVPLISVINSDQIISHIADAVGFSFTDQSSSQKQLLDHLSSKQLLLVLDNFEHLLADEQCIQLLDALLNASHHVKLIVTSREVLNLVQEQVYLLSGLHYPKDAVLSVEKIQEYDAIELFLRCTSQKLPQFSLNETNAHSIIRICHTLEGLPLGVELAAATICEQNCEQVAESYVDNLGALATRMRNFTTRHRSLNAAFELSWDLLTPKLKESLFRLSFFLDGFSAHAALHVAESPANDLTVLVSKSLLRRNEHGRFSMHEAIRQVVGEKVVPGLEPQDLMGKHAGYFADFLNDLKTDLLHERQTETLNAIHLEMGNLSQCWNYIVEYCDLDLLQKSMDSLFHYFNTRSLFEEGVAWFRRAVESVSQHCGDSLTLGMLLWRLGALAYSARDDQTTHDSLTKSEKLLEANHSPEELAYCRIYLGWVYQREKDFSRSREYVDLALEYFLSVEDHLGLTQAYLLTGSIMNRQGQYRPSLGFFEQAYVYGKKSENLRNLIIVINRLADISCYEGDYDRAVELYEEALQYSEELHDRYHQGMMLNNLGTIYHLGNELEKAKEYYQQSLAITRDIGDLDGTALALNNLGELATWQKDYQMALAYSQEALEIAQKLNESWTIVVCLNALGEISFGLQAYEDSKSYYQEALKQAIDINGLDLVARVLVNLARVYQQEGDGEFAAKIWKACLLHSATEQDSRDKAQQWLEESNIHIEDGLDDRWMNDLISERFS